MLSPKRLVAFLVVLAYGAAPVGTGGCDCGPDFKCSKAGGTCGQMFSSCCAGFDSAEVNNTCVRSSSVMDTTVSDTTRNQPPGDSR